VTWLTGFGSRRSPNVTWVEAPWFNTGVMLVRPKVTFYEELIYAASTRQLPFLQDGVSHAGGVVKSEQDILNGFVGPNWARLPARFNAAHSMRRMQAGRAPLPDKAAHPPFPADGKRSPHR
jgi:hypothetical protein